MRGKPPDPHPVSGSTPQGCPTPALKRLVLEKVLLTKHSITNLRAATSKSIYSSVSRPEGSGSVSSLAPCSSQDGCKSSRLRVFTQQHLGRKGRERPGKQPAHLCQGSEAGPWSCPLSPMDWNGLTGHKTACYTLFLCVRPLCPTWQTKLWGLWKWLPASPMPTYGLKFGSGYLWPVWNLSALVPPCVHSCSVFLAMLPSPTATLG